VNSSYRLYVFYDGVCPMCSREISHYRRLNGAEQIEWIDIHQAAQRLQDEGLRFEDALARFHVRDAAGRWHIGANGFFALWQVLPRYRPAARIIQLLHLNRPLNALYDRFAIWRIRRQTGCDDQCRPRPHKDS
jgi:predicted DCC family thiol-disulfide oxidoreductase YuxK